MFLLKYIFWLSIISFFNCYLFWISYNLQNVGLFQKFNDFYRNGYSIVSTLSYFGGGITLILGIFNLLYFFLFRKKTKNDDKRHYFYYTPLILGFVWIIYMILILNHEA
ncbi:MAG: hypothetical protein CVV22_04165 [Ignavibacteriae bacterium HGW-Ignavibacteriae-1]|nr:MAG: hypothetical protein CVV22_04165 [Ignavibacteriae bacterium HGW-Ignavibacteriae-1]